MRRVLHVAALPFPSPQGTQALLHHMLLAHQEAGYEPHLLCYAHGDGRATPYPVHRVADWPRLRSLRSGPSWLKPVLDVRLAASLRALRRRLAPDLIIAHHVEAAACAAAVLDGDWLFYAHTDLGAELPTYLRMHWARSAASAGREVDRRLVRHAPRTCAVSAPLAERLSQLSGRAVDAPPLPWPLPPALSREERAAARRTLGLARDDEVVLYAGNLDAYQGIEVWLTAFRMLATRRPQLTWLLATASEARPLAAELEEQGLGGRFRVLPLDGRTRELAHAVADIAVVPRRTPGGLPVKLLDALARGLPVVATRPAAAGLPLEELAWLVDEGPEALAEGVRRALDLAAERIRRRKLGRAYIAHRHSVRGWVEHPALAPLPGHAFGACAAPRPRHSFSVGVRRQW